MTREARVERDLGERPERAARGQQESDERVTREPRGSPEPERASREPREGNERAPRERQKSVEREPTWARGDTPGDTRYPTATTQRHTHLHKGTDHKTKEKQVSLSVKKTLSKRSF